MTTEPAFIHPNTRFVSQRLPNWLAALDEPAINAMGASLLSEQYTGASTQAAWFTRASADQQQALLASQQARATARLALAEVFKDFQGVLAFAEPRLKAHLKQQMNQDLDVHGTVLAHVVEHTSWLGLQRRYTPVNRTLLMAALHNFNADQAFGINSGVAERGSVAVDYVPRAEAGLQRPQNSDGSTLDANELAPIDDDYPLLRFQRGKTLAIRPQDFARECRTLDLGGQYQRYLHDRLLSPVNKTRVRDALMAARQAELRCLRQVALLKGDIDAATFAMIGQLLDDQPLTLAGQPMQAVTLEMLYAVPHEVVLFVPTSSADPQQPCIAWIAGDSHAPLCQYRHRGAFMASLVTRLRVPAYCNEFMDRISLAERQDFHARLTAQLALDTPAMMANTRAMGAQVLAHLHARHIGWLQSQALCVAISTEQVDRLATLDRWLGLLDTGVNLLNLAAMFIPALGPVMLPIIAAQAMNELYHGLADLADHQVEAAWSHLGGLALNIVLGVVAHQSLKAYGSVDPFVDDLLQVQMPDGQPRLWHADITAYAADLALDPAWRADAQGLYDVQGSHYVALDGKLYLTRVDALSAERVIVRPDGPAGFAPALRSNGRGSWLHQGEQPLTWPRNRLLRRLSPAASGLSDAAMEHVLDIAGIDEAVVRQAVSDLVPAPLELTDTLARLGDAQQLERLIASVRRGERWAEAWPMPVEQWVEHPRWPPSLVLEVFEGAEPWGVSTVYGDRAQAGARWVAVVRADLASADRMGQVLDAIGERACDELTGGPAASGRAAQVESLQQVFADHLHSRRAVVFQQATHLSAMPLPAQAAALPRDFPSLDGAQVRTLLEGATGEELERLSAGRVPLRMAEEARVLLRTRRIN
ncbi:dermonecrotic toxin domain-containing protein, partial [Pseudomonas sp.]|uniref:dermonecrotic toxin domain-containing protein n=1 Tax=Pseudomonas sp. TaxID=306 RepID=UPI003CC50348